MAKNYRQITIVNIVCRIFDKLINNKLVDQLKNCVFSSDFQYAFSLSCYTTFDFLMIIADTVNIGFDIFGAIQAVSLWHDSLTNVILR